MQRKNCRRKKIAYVLCGILAVVLFSGCQSTAADGTDEKVFVYGDTTFNAENDESDVNPHNGYSGWACIRYGIGETLFHYSDSMEIEPWLAESYELVDDTTWRITLHEKAGTKIIIRYAEVLYPDLPSPRSAADG